MHQAALGHKILSPAEFGIVECLGRTVSGSRHHAAPLGALDHLRLQMVNRHRLDPRAFSGRIIRQKAHVTQVMFKRAFQ
jgi:hypothetical protein